MFDKELANRLYSLGMMPEKYYVQLYLSPDEAESFFWNNRIKEQQTETTLIRQISTRVESTVKSAIDDVIKGLNGKK